MKTAILATAIALLLATGAAEANPEREQRRHASCDVSTNWSVETHRRAFVFTSEDKATEIGLGGGRLFIDGREQTLSAADHQRLLQLEREMHALIPEVRKIAVEAVDIAFTALTEVARGLASDPKQTIASLETAHRRVRAELNAQPLGALAGEAVESVVKPIITEFVPQIVGGAVKSALAAMLSGGAKADEFEARMERMEREIDLKVDARGKALEPLAEAMCVRLHRMDALDDALEFRLPSGQPLQLIEVDGERKRRLNADA